MKKIHVFIALSAYSFLAHATLFYLVVNKRSIASKWRHA